MLFFSTVKDVMQKVDVSSKQMWRYQGMWVAINPRTDRIVAGGETLEEIAPFVSGNKGQEKKIKAAAFKVPAKDEKHWIFPTLHR